MNIGDKGTIKRGKARGKQGEVVTISGADLAVKVLEPGDGPALIVLAAGTFEKDPEPVIEVRLVRNALQTVRGLARQADDHRSVDAIETVAGRLQIELASE